MDTLTTIDFGIFPDYNDQDNREEHSTYPDFGATSVSGTTSDCPICKEEYGDDDTARKPVTIPCGHRFHTVCLAVLFVPVGTTEWNEDYPNGRCPLCRTQLFHLPYKFYSEEMVREREENLRRDYEMARDQPPIRQRLTPEPPDEPLPEPEEIVPQIIQAYLPSPEPHRQVEGEEVLSRPVQDHRSPRSWTGQRKGPRR